MKARWQEQHKNLHETTQPPHNIPADSITTQLTPPHPNHHMEHNTRDSSAGTVAAISPHSRPGHLDDLDQYPEGFRTRFFPFTSRSVPGSVQPQFVGVRLMVPAHTQTGDKAPQSDQPWRFLVLGKNGEASGKHTHRRLDNRPWSFIPQLGSGVLFS